MTMCTGPLEEVVQIPRHNAPGFYVGHAFVDSVLERKKFLGLSFDSFFDG